MGQIIIAGKGFSLPEDIRVTTFLDPGGFSFYEAVGPQFVAKTYVNDMNESAPYISPRKLPPPAQGKAGLGGAGWAEAGDGDPIKALRRVVRTVVLHHDGAISSRACFETLKQRGLSTHFMIDADGHIYQATDVADEAVHASGVNAVSVGIDLNNPAPNLVNSALTAFPAGRSISEEMTINGGVFKSFTYTEDQYRSLIELLRVLCDVLGIEPMFPVGEDGQIINCVLREPPASEFRGIQCHWHSSADKWDPGPGFDWERVVAALRAEMVTVPVIPAGVFEALDAQDRLRYEKAVWVSEEAARKALDSAIKSEETGQRLLDAFCRAIEQRSGGGYYPIGVNQTWHGGVHIPARPGAMVRPMLPGELVAAHLVPREKFPSLGSNNFVLLRHRISLPPRFSSKRGGETEGGLAAKREGILTVYSLYMHLDGVDWQTPPNTSLFEKILSRTAGQGDPGEPRGPTLEANPKANQVEALKKGWVGLFSALDDEATKITLSPRDELWRVGVFGHEEDRKHVLHLEVFADSSYAEAMELSLYGKYLQLGPDEPESYDLVVRSRSLLAVFGEPAPFESRLRTEKVLSAAQIKEFFEERGDPEILRLRQGLRRMINRHVSEWSDKVKWVETLLKAQEGERWYQRLGPQRQQVGQWLFSKELSTYLQYVWLTEEVARHIGAKWENGVFTYFHPIYFLLWWLYRRSAVRGKTLEELLEELGGDASILHRGMTSAVEEVLSLPGSGEWSF